MRWIFNLFKNWLKNNWKKYAVEIIQFLVERLGKEQVESIVKNEIPQSFAKSSERIKFSDDKQTRLIDVSQNAETGELDFIKPDEVTVGDKSQVHIYNVLYSSQKGGLPGQDYWNWPLVIQSEWIPSDNDIERFAKDKADLLRPDYNNSVVGIRVRQ